MEALSHFLLSLLSIHTAFAQPVLFRPFPDVPQNHPAYEAVRYLQVNGIVGGYPDGTFKPDNLVNRAEFTKILVEAIAEQVVIETCLKDNPRLFTDVDNNEWYGRYVCTAKRYGMAYGNPDGTYRPNDPIIFVEAATLLARNFELDTQKPPEGLWYKPFVEALERKNAIPLSIAHFEQQITRGEMADMMYRIKSGIPPKPTQTYQELEILSQQEYVPRESQGTSSTGSVGSTGTSSQRSSQGQAQSASSNMSQGGSGMMSSMGGGMSSMGGGYSSMGGPMQMP
jgi:hypothetical protein